MILLITFMVMIIASVLIRSKLYRRIEIKQYEWITSLIVMLYIGFVSYWATDHYIGLIYSLLVLSVYFVLSLGFSFKNKLINILISAIGFPLFFLLYLKTSDYFLIEELRVFALIYVPIMIIRWNINTNRKQSKYEYLGLLIGLSASAAILYGYYEPLDGNKPCFQEKIAETYLVNELNISPNFMHADRKIRGIASEVRVTAENDTRIRLIYKNGKIISYDILE